MRKAIIFVLSLVLCLAFSMPVSAVNTAYGMVQPYYEKADDVKSELFINGTTATCTSTVIGDSDVIKIVIVQTLEKQGFLWSWSTYDNTTWTETVYSSSYVMSNKKHEIESGNYRLKTFVTLTDKNGKSETITVYSD